MQGLVGAWLLESFRMEAVGTGTRSEPFGPAPRGSLLLHPDGRMAALITPGGAVADGDPDRVQAPPMLVSYSGRYRIEPDRLVTSVDVSSIPAWVGTDQVRGYELDGDRLTLTTPPGRMPGPDGVEVFGRMLWRRERHPA